MKRTAYLYIYIYMYIYLLIKIKYEHIIVLLKGSTFSFSVGKDKNCDISADMEKPKKFTKADGTPEAGSTSSQYGKNT